MADSSLKGRPADPWLWTVRGMALDGMDKTEAALDSFDKALSFGPQYLPALKAAAQLAYLRRNARAPEYLNRLLALDPHQAAAHAMVAVLDYEAHHCADAIPHFEQSAQLTIGNVVSATEYAACLLDAHRTAEAVKVLTQAHLLHPGSRNLQYDLGLAQAKNGQGAEALETLKSPGADDAGILNLRASIESAAGNLDAAFADLKRAAEIDPRDERNYLDLALLALDHSGDQLAVEVLSVGIANLPKDAALYSVRGIANAELSRYDAAREDFAQAKRLDPERPLSDVAGTVLYMETNDPGKAKELLRQQVKKAPGDPTANTLLANLLVHQGATQGTPEYAEAKAAIARALKSDPNTVEALILTAEFDQDENDLPRALTALEKADKLEPENRTILNQLLLIFRKTGRKQDAAAVAQRLKNLIAKDAQQRNLDGMQTGPER